MTYIITIAGEDSIYMASDSRMNAFRDKEINGIRYQEIGAIADGMQKTFFLENLKIGIQFIGVGVLPYMGKKFPLSYFIKKLENIKGISIEEDFRVLFNFFKDLGIEGDTGQYVKGVMSAIDRGTKKVCFFNIFNNDFRINDLQIGKEIDSENIVGGFSRDEASIIREIKRRIMIKSREKWWTIGGEITILKIKKDGFEFLSNFKEDLNNIRWKIINPPRLEKYDLSPESDREDNLIKSP